MSRISIAALAFIFSCSTPLTGQWRPSIRFGDIAEVEFRAKIQAHVRGFAPHLETDEGAFALNRARFGIEGQFLRHFEYEVEREFRESVGGRESDHPWRDAFVNFQYFDDFQLQAGKFKVPFSREQLTAISNLDFISRSRPAENLAPARSVGVMLHGRFFNRGFGYEVGIFRHDGENAEPGEGRSASGATAAVRATGMPLRLFSAPAAFDQFEVAVAATSSQVDEGITSLRGETHADKTFFSRMPAKGRRWRAGTEFNWTYGPFSANGEYIRVNQARNGQSVRATDLPDLVSTGWYVAGTWVVTGEDKQDSVEPRRSFLQGGIGAVELAARYEELRFGSSAGEGLPSRSPRALNILANSDHAWTFGINWYANPYVKIQINGIRETIADPARSPVEGRSRFWMGIIGMQFVM